MVNIISQMKWRFDNICCELEKIGQKVENSVRIVFYAVYLGKLDIATLHCITAYMQRSCVVED